MQREIVKRKALQKMIKAEYKNYDEHKKFKLGKVFRVRIVGNDGCNWSISISRNEGWESAADFIRPIIIALRARYLLNEEI